MKSQLERNAQIAAAIAIRLPERRAEHGRLARIAYLADRETMRHHGHPICEGRRISTGDGALCIDVLRTVRDGYSPKSGGGLPIFASSDEEPCVGADHVGADDLDLLSAAEMAVLDVVTQRWGMLGAAALDEVMSDRTAFPELEGLDVGHEVADEAMFAALGDPDPSGSAEVLESHRRLDEVFEIVASSATS